MKTFLLLASLLLVACSAAEIDYPELTGSFSGAIGESVLVLNVTEAAGLLSGEGYIEAGTPAEYSDMIPLIIESGSHTYPDFEVVLASGSHATLVGSTNADGSALTGSLDGFGHTNASVTLTRQ